MGGYFPAILILLPALSAALFYMIDKKAFRNGLIFVTSAIMILVSIFLFFEINKSGGIMKIDTENIIPGVKLGTLIEALDIMLLVFITFIGFKYKKVSIIFLALLQLIPLFVFERTQQITEVKDGISIDYLSLVMILLVSIIGPIISIFGIGYMKEHEHHLHIKKSKQPRFFMVIFLFLGAMNALAITDNLMWMYFFWEVTTVCSFLLISHDGNQESIKNAFRALWMNLLGGVAFVVAIILIYKATNTVSINEIIVQARTGGFVNLLPIGIGLLCFAGFTKSAQFPFQSWLLGAMVAPTPVSALLHSSTMVKAGVFLIVRFSPAYSGTNLGYLVALVGGFTFLAGSAIAISQSNAKRVLAYSTIANLGLIICCAGLGSHAAIAVAVLLMIFHAVSKGLLFLCVGTIEQRIGSRDIEDMQGLMKKMPLTTYITVVGMITMLLPPFGVMISKWLAIEAAAQSPIILILLSLGSALTVVFWAKWIGIMLTASYEKKVKLEKLEPTVKFSLIAMLIQVLLSAIFIVQLVNSLVGPYLKSLALRNYAVQIKTQGLALIIGGMDQKVTGLFVPLGFMFIVLAVAILMPFYMGKVKPSKIRKPYLCGENSSENEGFEFISPGDKIESVIVRNYYLTNVFGEEKLTTLVNVVGLALILVMFGVAIW